jgi:hypothetical protein
MCERFFSIRFVWINSKCFDLAPTNFLVGPARYAVEIPDETLSRKRLNFPVVSYYQRKKRQYSSEPENKTPPEQPKIFGRIFGVLKEEERYIFGRYIRIPLRLLLVGPPVFILGRSSYDYAVREIAYAEGMFFEISLMSPYENNRQHAFISLPIGEASSSSVWSLTSRFFQ